MIRPASPLLLLSLLLLLLLLSRSLADSHFEGFDADEDDDSAADDVTTSFHLSDLPLTKSHSLPSEPDPNPNPTPDPNHSQPDSSPSQSQPQTTTTTTATSGFDFWDEDEFEGLPLPADQLPPESPEITKPATDEGSENLKPDSRNDTVSGSTTTKLKKQSYAVEIACISFLIIFAINYFTGKRENENIALSWAAKFATKDAIFERNFSLLGVGDGAESEDSPLLLKEGQNVFKFYASGRRFCSGLLATMELKSRHDLISRAYNMIVPCKDEISFEVYMNDDAMDHVVFAVAKKKLAKTMQREVGDLQRFAGVMEKIPLGRKWVAEELSVVSESKEVAADLITDAVVEQVFGDKSFEKYGKGFISMHFSDQHPGPHKKMLLFKFALPNANNMDDMARLVALIPYYIDLIGRYKLSSQARSKTEAARVKASQEAYKELQNARQEALQKKKAERRKMIEETDAKLSAEATRKKEAKERARRMKKAMPKIKMSRAS